MPLDLPGLKIYFFLMAGVLHDYVVFSGSSNSLKFKRINGSNGSAALFAFEL